MLTKYNSRDNRIKWLSVIVQMLMNLGQDLFHEGNCHNIDTLILLNHQYVIDQQRGFWGVM